MFPGANAMVYRNEAGEVLGWDYPSREDEMEYNPDDYLASYDDDDDDDDDVYCDAQARKGTGTGTCDRVLDEHGQCDRASSHL